VRTLSTPARPPVARILTIGDELTFGEVVDRNKAHMARRCRALGLVVESMVTVRDRVDEIVDALHDAAFRAGVEVVLCSGGLGPTTDDLTAQAVARAAGVPLQRDPESLARLETLFAARGREVLEINRKQADLPAGGAVLANPIGTAPGFAVELIPGDHAGQHGMVPSGRAPCLVCCMPGVPREMHRMLSEQVEPRLRERLALDPAPARVYRVFGRGESQVQEAITPALRELASSSVALAAVLVHYRAHQGEVLVQLEATRASTGERATEVDLIGFDAPFRDALGRDLYGIGEADLPTRIVRAAAAAGVRIAGAESCTGGLASSLLTAIPGASACFVGTHVTYTNAAKAAHLGVSEDLLAAHGAVSQPVAEEMARGAQRAFAADIAFAITGIAGPDGGTADKPVGTVHLAVAERDGQVVHRRVRLPGDRDFIRRTASLGALRLVWDGLVDRGVATTDHSSAD
jgi:nicotinamide-nucleotide amidase